MHGINTIGKRLPKALSRLIIIVLVLLKFSLFAQPGYKMKPEDERLVNIYKKKFPREDFVSLNSSYEISFEIDKKNKNLVTVEKIVKHELLALKEDVKFSNAIFYNDQSEVNQIRARDGRGRTLNTIPVLSDYQADGIFYSDAKVCFYELPATHAGDHIEISYVYYYKDIRYFTSEYFNERFPVAEKTIQVDVPEWLDISLEEFNFASAGIKKTVQNADKIKSYSYTGNNLSALKDEPYAPSFSRTYPHLFMVSKSFRSGGETTKIFSNVDDLYGFYVSIINQCKNDPEPFTPFVKNLIKDKKSDEDKIAAIFYWIQDNIRYIAFENGIMGFKPQNAQTVYKNTYGDCKGMANLMCEMLKVAGLDARLTWIGTNSKPYSYSTPSIAVDNHMICSVILNDKILYLDGTEKYIALNDYAVRIQGREVLIEDGPKYMLKTIPHAGWTRNKRKSEVKLKLQDLTLSGTSISVFEGEEKTSILYHYNSMRTDDRDKALVRFISSNNPNLTITNAQISDVNKRDQAVEVKSGITIVNNVVKVGSELYIDLDSEDFYADMVIDTNRFAGLDLDYGFEEVYTVEFTIPQGYKPDYTPELLVIDNEYITINAEYKTQDGIVHYTRKTILKNPMIEKSKIQEWNQNIENLKKFYKDQLILIKS